MNSQFTFPDIDIEGRATLDSIAQAARFNGWMYEVTSRNLQGKTLEIGSGTGTISDFYFSNRRPLYLSDIRENYCQFLETRFAQEPLLAGVYNLDLVHPEFETAYAELLGTFDAVFALNVVEHIENDRLAIENCKKLLKKGGRLLVLVPAYQALYNNFDRALEHYRRYTKTSLRRIFAPSDFEIHRTQYFNLAAIAGWWFSGSVLKKNIIPNGQMKIFNSFVPIFKLMDKVVGNKVGISVIVEAIKR
jgi:SAM-dependent methyltransferase